MLVFIDNCRLFGMEGRNGLFGMGGPAGLLMFSKLFFAVISIELAVQILSRSSTWNWQTFFRKMCHIRFPDEDLPVSHRQTLFLPNRQK